MFQKVCLLKLGIPNFRIIHKATDPMLVTNCKTILWGKGKVCGLQDGMNTMLLIIFM